MQQTGTIKKVIPGQRGPRQLALFIPSNERPQSEPQKICPKSTLRALRATICISRQGFFGHWAGVGSQNAKCGCCLPAGSRKTLNQPQPSSISFLCLSSNAK